MANATARKSLWDPTSPLEDTHKPQSSATQPTTRDILRTANEINSVADATLTDLDLQGKKLAHAQDGVARIGDRMNGADRLIHEIGSFWGTVMNKFRSAPNTTEHAARRDAWESEHEERMAAYRETPTYKKGTSSAPTVASTTSSQYADDEEGDLEQIHAAVIEMRRKALLMGEAIEDHNHRLDNLALETDIATGRIRTAKGKIGVILKK
jgi:hypothetical protein